MYVTFLMMKKNGTNIHLEHPYYLHPKTWKNGGSVFGTGFAGGTKAE